jgi:hypothetical protein
MHNGATYGWRRKRFTAPTRGLVFRVGFDCAFSSSDSDALERRLGSGLLLRHPQVSNQNSKERTQSIRREVANTLTPVPENITLHPRSFLFWPTLPLIPSLPLLRHHPTEQSVLLITVIVPFLFFLLDRLFFSIVCNPWYCKQRPTNKFGPVHFGSDSRRF